MTDPQLYVQNGCKNWSLIHKHAAILEQKCKGKLPKRADIPKLLANNTHQNELFNSSDKEESCSSGFDMCQQKTTAINPAMAKLQHHGVVFSKKQSPTPNSSTLYRCAPSNQQEEREQLNMVLNQSLLEQHNLNMPPFQYFPAVNPSSFASVPVVYAQFNPQSLQNGEFCNTQEEPQSTLENYNNSDSCTLPDESTESDAECETSTSYTNCNSNTPYGVYGEDESEVPRCFFLLWEYN